MQKRTEDRESGPAIIFEMRSKWRRGASNVRDEE